MINASRIQLPNNCAQWGHRMGDLRSVATASSERGATSRWIVPLAALATAMLASGCAGFSPDAGMGVVQAATAAELGKEVTKLDSQDKEAHAAARVKQLLAKPLTAASAVQIALLNNRGLQAAYNELGISEAQMVEASLPPAPRLGFARLVGSGGFEIERQIVQNVLALLTLPRRREIAEARFRQAQVRAVEATLRISAETSRAYYRAVAANRFGQVSYGSAGIGANRIRAGKTARRDRRHVETRPGARARLLCRDLRPSRRRRACASGSRRSV